MRLAGPENRQVSKPLSTLVESESQRAVVTAAVLVMQTAPWHVERCLADLLLCVLCT